MKSLRWLNGSCIPKAMSRSCAPKCDDLQRAESIAAAYNDALERVLGAPAGSLNLIDAQTLKEWFVSGGEV